MSNLTAEEVNKRLMNLKVVKNGKDFGTIYRIDNVIDNGCEYFECYTTLGRTFNANLILNAIINQSKFKLYIADEKKCTGNGMINPVNMLQGLFYFYNPH